MALLRLSAPWQTFYKELCVLFSQDPEVHIVYDQDELVINMYVENETKSVALNKLLPEVLTFGNVELQLKIVPANKVCNGPSLGNYYKDAFYKNPIVDDIVTVEGIMTNTITYVIFKKEVVQYWNDDIGDAHGVCSTLYQDVAGRVFEEKEGVFFCTNVDSKTVPSLRKDYYWVPVGNSFN